ncbi:MAG TPA: signal peptide peptidase SppA [Candidatus Methanoperedens sp.]|nr:signal peptide peptidase SppA [Candidatus Methanoperedens sp.]HLB69493.1 signal peptide peptidase SppA [Candidatus Methanoperedens sp.]
MSESRKILLYFSVLFFLLIIVGGSFYLIFAGRDFAISGNRVEVIYVQGIMLTGSIPSGFGIATSEEITKSLKDASEDRGVKAIVMRINSPGGSAAAAQEIVGAMKKIDKPIVISMGDVAASGGYYISVPADKIIANPDTITGSIGVIWEFQNRSKFYNMEGTSFYIAKSGALKDMGGDWRGLTDEEKKFADQIIEEAYLRFVKEVAENRNLSLSKVKDLADGRVYTGAKAKELGLIDDFGSLDDAIEIAARLGGIEGRPEVTYANKPSLSRLLFGGEKLDTSQYTRYFDESPYGRLLSIT